MWEYDCKKNYVSCNRKHQKYLSMIFGYGIDKAEIFYGTFLWVFVGFNEVIKSLPRLVTSASPLPPTPPHNTLALVLHTNF